MQHHVAANPEAPSHLNATPTVQEPQDIQPRLNVIRAGQEMNAREHEFVEKELEKGRIFPGSPQSIKETSISEEADVAMAKRL